MLYNITGILPVLCHFPGLLAVISFFLAANLSSVAVPFVIFSPFLALFSPSSLSLSELSPSSSEEDEESLPDDDEDESDIILLRYSTFLLYLKHFNLDYGASMYVVGTRGGRGNMEK